MATGVNGDGPQRWQLSSASDISAAGRNIRKAAAAAKRKKTISKLPKRTRTALGKQGAKVARRKASR